MKVISYSLFKGPDPLAELFYVRGFYFNALMNSIVYPEWETHLIIGRPIYQKYQDLITHLQATRQIIVIPVGSDTRCMDMISRMIPVFYNDTEYVICRDADALTSVREANAVDAFINSGKIIHGLHDNPAHSIPLMGGMCGFKCFFLREKYKNSFEWMISKYNGKIDEHGTDQNFLNKIVYEDFKESFQNDDLRDVKKTHGSDLCTSFIGSAGCNEFETLRFFRSHLPNWGSDQDLWKQYPQIFYWHGIN